MAEDPPLPRTERPDAPLYLASYLRRRARAATPEADSDASRGRQRHAAVPAPVPGAAGRPRRPRRAPAGLERRAPGGDQGLGRDHPDQGDRPRDPGRRLQGGRPGPHRPPRRDPGVLDRERPHPPRRLAGPPARLRPVQGHPRRRAGPDRLRRHQPGPPDGRAPPPRPARRPRPVAPRRQGRRAAPDGRVPQLPGRHPRRPARRDQRLPHVPRPGRALRAGRPRGPADVAGRGRPVLERPAGRGRPHPPLDDHPHAPLRAAGQLRAPLLVGLPAAGRRGPRGPHPVRHPLRPHPGVRRLGGRLRPGRALQHRGSPGEAEGGRRRGPGRLPQPGPGGPGPADRRNGPTGGRASDELRAAGWTATTRPSGPASAARTPASGSCWPPGCRCRPGSRSPSTPTTPSAATPRSARPWSGCSARSTWATRPPWRS